MSHFNKLILLITLLLPWLIMCNAKIIVNITNYISPFEVLTFHCRSNDDLGEKSLVYEKSWHFEFNKQLFGSTIFKCDFSFAKKKIPSLSMILVKILASNEIGISYLAIHVKVLFHVCKEIQEWGLIVVRGLLNELSEVQN
ncbi:hypothetical protein Patl1_15654 [Pistacia atlantica]|uniref:Uncharacterized protein n=1 Tax=Pistacia atlantica TaxID=434234 RepID=A0ACC1B8G7_9ROSI|nr:hypothetical protein Patl1_15654 [Pistacia atlantica]